MPIEFRCTECGKLLRTPDDAAGKQAKCPACGALVAVPEPAAAPPPPPPELPGSPFGEKPGYAPQPGPVNPYASPAAHAPSVGEAVAAAGISRQLLDLGDVLNRTWEIYKVRWGLCLGVVLLVILVNMVASTVFSVAAAVVAMAARDPLVNIGTQVIDNVCTWLFQTWIGIGQALFLLAIARGQEPPLGLVFSGGRYFGKIVAGALLVMLAAGLPVLVCIMPGLFVLVAAGAEAGLVVMALGGLVAIFPAIYISLMFSQYYYLILDRDLDVLESLSVSRELMVGNKLMLFAIGVVAFLLMVAGLLACCVGVLAVMPYGALLAPVIDRASSGQPIANFGPAAPTPPPGDGYKTALR